MEETMEILKTLKDRCDPRYAALIVVDVQNDFVSPEGSAGKRGDDVGAAMAMIPNLTGLIDQARKIGFTVVYIIPTRRHGSIAHRKKAA
jgi:ureidoacrylate peracid hydrolase